MKDLRILFMGTPEFAVSVLDKMITENFQVIGVVTAPDKPAGRGKKIHISAVKQYALDKGLPVFQPTNLKSDAFQATLQAFNPNLHVVVAFRMLPKKVWGFPKYGTFNLHASLLPAYRGAAPINWAIINGEKNTGVTTFFIDEKIDTGNIILQEKTNISPTDTAGSLHDKLMHQGADLVVKTLRHIQQKPVPATIPQPQEGIGKTAYKLTSGNTKIDWGQPAEKIYNFIRGLTPYPVAHTLLHNNGISIRCKIYAARYKIIQHQQRAGKVAINHRDLSVYTKDGAIIIEQLQLPGKRKMNTEDLLNGFSFDENAYMS